MLKKPAAPNPTELAARKSWRGVLMHIARGDDRNLMMFSKEEPETKPAESATDKRQNQGKDNFPCSKKSCAKKSGLKAAALPSSPPPTMPATWTPCCARPGRKSSSRRWALQIESGVPGAFEIPVVAAPRWRVRAGFCGHYLDLGVHHPVRRQPPHTAI